MLNPLAFVGSTGRVNTRRSTQATLQEIHTFSPNLVNQIALGYTRWYLDVTNADIGNDTSQKLGLQGSNTTYEGSGLAVLSLSGYTGESASNSIPEIVPQNTEQLSDTISWTHGQHSMKFGGSVIHNDFGFFQLTSPAGALTYTGTYTNNPVSTSGTGNPWADFLLGLPASSSKVSVPYGVPYLSYTEGGLFWRISGGQPGTHGDDRDTVGPVYVAGGALQPAIGFHPLYRRHRVGGAEWRVALAHERASR